VTGFWAIVTVVLLAMPQGALEQASSIEAEIHRTGSVPLYTVRFVDGTATLEVTSEATLAEVVKLMKDRTDWRFEVQGHTDNRGAKAASLSLSDERAKAVVAWLIRHGIDASRLAPKGYGDTAPLADNTTEDGRAKNRRVELKKLNDE